MTYNVMGLMSISRDVAWNAAVWGEEEKERGSAREMHNKRNECNLVPRVSLQRKGREKLGERLKRMLNSQPTTNLIPFVVFLGLLSSHLSSKVNCVLL